VLADVAADGGLEAGDGFEDAASDLSAVMVEIKPSTTWS
jgi:hypothetical protein